MRAFIKNGRRLSDYGIRAEARKRQKEMRDVARAAEMTEEEVALEKLKFLAEKGAVRKAATGQTGKDKRSGRSRAQGSNGASRQYQARIGRSRAQGYNGASRQVQTRIGRSRAQGCNGSVVQEHTRSGRCHALGQKDG
jgi:hypothetical protein